MIDVVYIAGSGRSGSTLLERILGQTTSFVAIGELRHLWRADYETDLCGCGLTFQSCPFWQPILADIFADSASIQFGPMLTLRNQVDRIRYLPYMLLPVKTAVYRQRHARYTRIIEQIYCQIQTQYGNQYIIDSSKDISTLYLVAKMPSVRLHVIHMVRDSRAVAYSWQRKRVKHQVTKQVTYMPTYSPAYAAFDWAYRNSFVAWGKPLYDSYHFMRYEDLVQDPVTILNKLTGELGIPSVDWSFINQATLRLLQTTHTASGNPMRFQSGALALKLDDIWKQEMSDRSKRIVTGLNWPWLRRYQYV
jgi:hypothetical protein